MEGNTKKWKKNWETKSFKKISFFISVECGRRPSKIKTDKHARFLHLRSHWQPRKVASESKMVCQELGGGGNGQLLFNVHRFSPARWKISTGTSLMVQWLRICLLIQATQVRSLVRSQDPTCFGATKPGALWLERSTVPQLLRPHTLEPVCCN